MARNNPLLFTAVIAATLIFTNGILLNTGYGISESPDRFINDNAAVLSPTGMVFNAPNDQEISYYHIDNEVPCQILILYLEKRETSPPSASMIAASA